MRSRHPLAGAFCHTKMLLLTALVFNIPAAHAQSGSVEVPGSALGFGDGLVDQQPGEAVICRQSVRHQCERERI
jgi:hypothetical protein